MHKELADRLYANYPALFVERNLPPDLTCMSRGIECGDGWYGLIDTLCSTLQWWVEHCDMPPVRVTQVKEKLGSLRFRFKGGDDRTQGMVRMAEAISRKICNTCGCSCDRHGDSCNASLYA